MAEEKFKDKSHSVKLAALDEIGKVLHKGMGMAHRFKDAPKNAKEGAVDVVVSEEHPGKHAGNIQHDASEGNEHEEPSGMDASGWAESLTPKKLEHDSGDGADAEEIHSTGSHDEAGPEHATPAETGNEEPVLDLDHPDLQAVLAKFKKPKSKLIKG